MGVINFSFDDERLNDRGEFCFSKLRKQPALSFPQQFNQPKELQAFYRFINNVRVGTDEITDSVVSNTKVSVGGMKTAIAVHDTSHVSPSAKAGKIEEFKFSKGFFAHVSLIVDSSSLKRIHGVGGLHIWNRSKKRAAKGKTGEFDRWLNQVNQVEADLPNIELIHVMDREGDASSVWADMHANNRRFVIRAKSIDRPAMVENGERSWLVDELKKELPIAQRTVMLSKRKVEMPNVRYNARDRRETVLNISAKSINLTTRSAAGGPSPKTVNLNVVRVYENSNRPEKDRVEWFLLTSEPIKTVKQILRVVDIYKSRWIIEEFFKALKTGCRLEERLLEDAKSWHKLVALFLPIACALLNMRLNHEDTETGKYFSPLQMQILKLCARAQGKHIKTIKQAQLQMANLGGHINANGPPGWITLFRGYQQLIAMEQGWRLSQYTKNM